VLGQLGRRAVSTTSGDGKPLPQRQRARVTAVSAPPPVDPLAIMRSRSYVRLLVLAVLLAVPIAGGAYWFLKLTELLQEWTFTSIPSAVGFSSTPTWWPLLPLFVAGSCVGLVIRYLPGSGGESPVNGFSPGGLPVPVTLPGILVAAIASIGLGAVVGPEGPLVALGGGAAYLVVWLVRRDTPQQAAAIIAGTGSFAAISTLLGTPIAGAFLLLEATGIGGAMATAVLLPGLLAAGIGSLIFTGLDNLTGYGTFSLTIPNVPPIGTPTGAEFGYALVIGLAAGAACVALRWFATRVRDSIRSHLVLATPVLGLGIAGSAIVYAEVTVHPSSDVLFSGQTALPGLVEHGTEYSVGALLLLVLCKGLAYTLALAGFRGGPTFPAMFLGAAGGMALSHAPGLPLTAGVAMGLAAMTAGMLRLPMTAVLLATLLLGAAGFSVMPLTIVAAIIAYLTANWLVKGTTAGPDPATPPAQREPAVSTSAVATRAP
jgi:H+/Cl- antiporter ClcA